MANSPSGDSVIRRAVRILSAFTDAEPALHIRDLARRTELPVSTTHRLATELELEGLLVRDDSGRLRHGQRMWEIASRGSTAASLRAAALPLMVSLLTDTGCHVSLGVLDGAEVLYLERLAPDELTVNITRVAGRLPVHGCSAGLTFMAFASEDVRERFLRRRLPKLTESTVVDPAELRQLLGAARRDGYVAMSGIIVEESSGISVPIFGPARQVVATLTVIAPLGAERLAAIVPQMKMASRGVSRRLGHEPTLESVRQGRLS